jgi:hypothetical protein
MLMKLTTGVNLTNPITHATQMPFGFTSKTVPYFVSTYNRKVLLSMSGVGNLIYYQAV